MKQFLGAFGVSLLLAGCSTHAVQTSSGGEYLAQYAQSRSAVTAADAATGEVLTDENGKKIVTLDDLVREAAAVEPVLRLPAHIGIARIHNGKLTDIPEAELAVWQKLAEKHPNLGRVSVVDPLIAEFTAESFGLRSGYRNANAIPKLRIGAARQHMDAVLLYDIGVETRKENTALAFLDVTVVGGAFFPTRSIKVEGTAQALLVGVLNGYPYGTARTRQEFKKLSPSWGSDNYRGKLTEETAATLVADLIPQVEAMIDKLKPALAKQQQPAS